MTTPRPALAASPFPRARSLVASGALLALALAACGDDTTGSGAAGGGSGPASTAATGEATASTGTADTTSAGSGDGGQDAGQGGGGAPGDGGAAGDGGASSGAGGGAVVVGGDRPVEVFVPSGYDGSPTPLVVMLHGYSATAAIQEAYLRVEPLAEELGFLYVNPQGTTDPAGEPFWNATDACCNFYGSGVDDGAYLRGIVDDVAAELNVDPRRVYFMGHSNGGFMSYRMACEHADVIAAVASLAGATFDDVEACAPSAPVAALQIHGTADTTILYEGGQLVGNTYPAARITAETWAAYGGCMAEPAELPARDLEAALAGSESSVLVWSDACDAGGSAELWTIEGGSHIPALAPDFTRQVVEWLLAHPKP